MPVGGPIFQAFAKAASFTARGAAVTFGSTILSCMAACKIEQGANRLIYHYAPHKFANVEWANGLTQEQLDAVRIYQVETEEQATRPPKNQEHVASLPTLFAAEQALLEVVEQSKHTAVRQESEHENFLAKNYNKLREDTASTKTRFWKEGEEAFTALIPVALPRQEILACAMTG
ncbi:hypothetical protein IV203_031735 [Nitzschia inconspicua]|uniref:Uncharacterized protein n=1 Tax=Nitzschia inconspicua TaxID=303405 RepID=A0A9K3LVS7_9STRA|nr:hypothetical protein IV203_031735 [Nitzschia inconspicua]